MIPVVISVKLDLNSDGTPKQTAPGELVVFTCTRPDSSSFRVGNGAPTKADGSASISWVPDMVGKFSGIAALATDANYLATPLIPFTFTVTGPTPPPTPAGKQPRSMTVTATDGQM